MKIYYILDKKNETTRFYNYFFIILVSINLFIMLTLVILTTLEISFEDFVFSDTRGNSYIFLTHIIFSFSSSSILFFFGIHIKNMIRVSLKDSFKVDTNYYIEDNEQILENKSKENDNSKITNTNSVNDSQTEEPLNTQESDSTAERDIYFSIRMTQINIITMTFFICDIYQLFYSISKMTLLSSNFQNEKLKVTPVTFEGAILFFLNSLSILLPIFSNYITFYFIIRESYKIKRRNSAMPYQFYVKEFYQFADNQSYNAEIEEYIN